ncbi:MAG TPA: ATP-binding protein [Bacteroidia bacterium]|nr:ATP-binding protein [Bacteroidia bacterium]HNU32957.1 ATP-binding protein [Bacteroidia bacterium]
MSDSIKDIWLGLPDYKYYHQPIKDATEDDTWVGREIITEKLKSYILDGKKQGGAYLITGYRGMGKTSFVQRAIEDVKRDNAFNKRKRIQEVVVSFGQRDIKELDILRQIIKGISNNLLEPNVQFIHEKFFKFKSFPVWIFIGVFVLNVLSLWGGLTSFYIKNIFSSEKALEMLIAFLIVSLLLGYVLQLGCMILFRKWKPIVREYDRLLELYDRCVSQVTKEAGAGGIGEKFPINFTDKLVKQFSIANPKEVENEIINALVHIRDKTKNNNGVQFVFVFDEIDKIEPAPERPSYYHEELSQFEKKDHSHEAYEYKERRKVVINILANLKYLITTAEAKFIFIAGREMFDASLADVADRQSYISSIFHQIINVDSFLKDGYDPDDEKTSGVLTIIEDYLEKLLLPNLLEGETREEKKSTAFLRRYYKHLESTKNYNGIGLSDAARFKIIYTLQNFIVFIAYRSNGAPKKVVRLIESFIRKSNYTTPPYQTTTNGFVEDDSKNGLYINTSSAKQPKPQFYLHFDGKNQYRFSLLSYLYRPFLINYSNANKSVSDSILVSTPYLMDHIMKFHPFAFSLKNLEMVPELLSETRTPELRNFIEELVAYLSLNHIRDTEISLFDYKFLNKTYHEISYLCKMFEEESAAFNFTLGETNQVKTLLSIRIKELRSIYKEFIPKENSEYVHSLSYLNEVLGDTHFNDQEYVDAITSYSDAIQNMEKIPVTEFNVEHYIQYLKIKLKQCLAYGKIKSFEQAAAGYVHLIYKTKQFISTWKNVGATSYTSGTDELSNVSSKADLFRLVIQPYVGELFLQEKISDEGVTDSKIKQTITNFIRTVLSVDVKQRYHLSMHSLFSSIATLLYYKNLPEKRSKKLLDDDQKFLAATNYETKNFNNDVIEYLNIVGGYTQQNANLKSYRISPLSYCFYKQSLRKLINALYVGSDKGNSDYINKATLVDLLRIAENVIYLELSDNLVLKSQERPSINNFNYLLCKQLDKNILQNLAVILSKIGDCLLAGLHGSNLSFASLNINNEVFSDLNKDKNSTYWSFYNSAFRKYKDLGFNFDIFYARVETPPDLLLALVSHAYFLSGNYFMRVSRNQSASFQFRKIIDVLNKYLCADDLKNYENLIEKWFLHMLLKLSSWNSAASDRFQIYKYKHYTNQDTFFHDKNFTKYNYINTSNSPEIRESVLFFINTKIKTGSLDLNKNDLSNFISEYSSYSTQFIRLRELNLRAKINYLKLNENRSIRTLLNNWKNIHWVTYKSAQVNAAISNKSTGAYLNDVLYKPHLKKKINVLSRSTLKLKTAIVNIVDSINCLSQIISIMNRFGINYLMNHSALADSHRRAGDWMVYYELFRYLYRIKNEINNRSKLVIIDEDFDIEKLLKQKLGGDIAITMDAISHYQLALQNYHSAKLMHSEGKVYKSQITNMYYLEDDFGDSLYHYCIALERSKINSGKIDEHIKELRKSIDTSLIYDVKNYY